MGDFDNPNWGGGLKGAAGGALAGSAIAPGIGTLIGGGIGGLMGLFGSNENDQMKQKLQSYYESLNNMQAPQAGAAAQSATSGFRTNQSNLISRLEALSKGQGPSLAAEQFQQATDRNVSGQQAMANSGRGGPMAQLTAANNMASLGAQAAQGSAIARTGEELGAFGQLGQAIGTGREQDQQNSQFNAGQQNNTALANLRARLDTMNLSAQQKLQILSQMQGNANQPGLGDQLLAGGAGMYSMGFGKGGGASPFDPQGYGGYSGRNNSGQQQIGGYDKNGNGYGYQGQ